MNNRGQASHSGRAHWEDGSQHAGQDSHFSRRSAIRLCLAVEALLTESECRCLPLCWREHIVRINPMASGRQDDLVAQTDDLAVWLLAEILWMYLPIRYVDHGQTVCEPKFAGEFFHTTYRDLACRLRHTSIPRVRRAFQFLVRLGLIEYRKVTTYYPDGVEQPNILEVQPVLDRVAFITDPDSPAPCSEHYTQPDIPWSKRKPTK